MAQIIRSAKHSLIEDLINGRKTLTSPVIKAITGATSVTALAGSAFSLNGADGYNVGIKLGDDDGTEYFLVEDVLGVDLFKISSAGVITLENGATITNSSATDTLTITETKIGLTGAVTITGATVADGITADSLTATAGEALEINGADGFDVKVVLGDDDGTESFIVEEVDGDDLFKVGSTGLITLKGGAVLDNVTSADELKITETGVKVVGNTKLIGEVTTRNAADDSMYTAVAASLGHERLWKVAGKVTANDGGYFEALYVNAATTTTATLGRIVGTESKVTINANMDAGATAEALYAKISVADASEVANAYGLYVEMEESGSGAITQGTGVYVKGGDGIIDYAIDVAQDYRMAAIRLPQFAGAAITAATIAGAGAPTQGSLDLDTGLVGLYKDSSDDAVSAVFKYAGLYYHVKLTDTTDS